MRFSAFSLGTERSVVAWERVTGSSEEEEEDGEARGVFRTVPFMGRREQIPLRDQVKNRSGDEDINVAEPRRRYDAKGAGERLRRFLYSVHEPFGG